ncbi:N-acyl-phosphatidylethanolamine-hydrolyzing phospholipase D [Amylostereum chailletii]|nr:N-acyl-phosphatidylethanolamine-hydrolyzing phospholipase D [Amylostereum chailletii]
MRHSGSSSEKAAADAAVRPPAIDVAEPPRRFPSGYVDGALPAHHLNATKTKFKNPWPSHRFLFLGAAGSSAQIPPNVKELIPWQKPTWGTDAGNEDKAKATWLGHACYLLELPTPQGAARGPRIIFDPVFSNRCSPFQWLGPARYTDPPCTAEEVPAVDAIVLSHNHYDHTDIPTLRGLLSNPSCAAHVFVSLNTGPLMRNELKLPAERVHELDWWDERILRVSLPSSSPSAPSVDAHVRITSTPAQHVCARGPFDRWAALWTAWFVEELVGPAKEVGKKLYFAGDTAYRTVKEGEDEDEVPVCPAFAEVGERFGGADVALLPIGAYAPREIFSNMHATPGDAVRMFKDVRAKKALAMHWGTWVLTTEPVLEPPELLRKECMKAGVSDDEFLVPGLGETTLF